ncbi:MAG TPA: TIR domain-containing protein [Thermoanaerobaculia bacterium]|jgi:tetratricopeptide (TPR) repeat protein|nr:TIR domain-containing protein [Thermoanaerobaculia bacterium]
MSGPTVFISYSHKDETWKDQLVGQLRVLELEGGLEVWDDRKIAAGDGWRAEITTAVESARAAVLLISADFLTSGFIRGTEVPHLLQRRAQDGLRIIPLIVRPCPWRRVPWLAEIQSRPTDGRPITDGNSVQIEKDLSALAEEIADLLGHKPKVGEGLAPSREGGGQPHLDLGRLPIPGPHFVGREAELARLDAAWEDPAVHVLTLVAFGGVGKSALVARWLDRMAADGWRGAVRVLDWSFYSQGTKDQVTSAEPFINYALRFFGDPDPQASSPYDRGNRLAHLMRKERTLLILDGVEPLQYPPGRPEIEGRLKDPGLTALLKGLAVGNPGLCVVTTRERIADLTSYPTTAPQISLEEIDPDAAVELLRQLGVAGRERDLRAAVKEFGRHALTLTLLGNYLRRAHSGDIRKRKEIDLHRADEKQGGHAFRVIAAYARWLGEGPELATLRLLGLFDRPAEAGALKALRVAPPIPGLTEPLVDLSDEDWRLAVTTLRDHNLLAAADPREPETLDAHPLVRACFAEEIESRHPIAWQEGNGRLYEHLAKAAPDLPDTLETMQPLYAAVVHGCRAGRQQEAMDEVYRRRILRGKEFYSTKQLGAFGSELTALAGFFDGPWSQPSTLLTAMGQAFALNEAAFVLRALGRLAEAVEPTQLGLDADRRMENWESAAKEASNLSHLTLTLGDVPGAVAFSEQSIELADRSGVIKQIVSSWKEQADALHQAGRWEESAVAFSKTEAMGFRYCDLLLSRAEPEDGGGLGGFAGPGSFQEKERFRTVCRKVLKQGNESLRMAENKHLLLDVPLHHLSLGRAYLGLALTAPQPADPGDDRAAGLAQATESLDQAVDGLRMARREDHLPLGLLARAALRRFRHDFTGAAADLIEVLEIAERGRMRLHECDAHLEWARLHRDQGDVAAARRHMAQARVLVTETGYGRREREVRWLEGVLVEGAGTSG